MSREKSSLNLRTPGRWSKTYGSSLSSSTSSSERLYKYVVQPGDTVRSVSIRFGIRPDRIRTINKLWSDETLFFKEFILIPIHGAQQPPQGLVELSAEGQQLASQTESEDKSEGESEQLHGTSDSTEQSSLEQGDQAGPAAALFQPTPDLLNDHPVPCERAKSQLKRSQTLAGPAPGPSLSNESGISSEEFLSKFDAAFQGLKSNVTSLKQRNDLSSLLADQDDDDELVLYSQPYQRAPARLSPLEVDDRDAVRFSRDHSGLIRAMHFSSKSTPVHLDSYYPL